MTVFSLTVAVLMLCGYLLVRSSSYDIKVPPNKASADPLLQIAEFSVPGCIVKEALRPEAEHWVWVHKEKVSRYCMEQVLSRLQQFEKEDKEVAIRDPFSPNFFDYLDIEHMRIKALVSRQIDPNLYKLIEQSSLDACIYTLLRNTSGLEASIFVAKEAEPFCRETLLLKSMTLSPKWQTTPSYYLDKDLKFELFE